MSASKQKGTAFESLVLREFKLHYPGAERRAMQGALDKGDLLLPGEDRFVVECKNVSRWNLPEWLREAEAEARNAGVPYGVVASKRRGNAQPGDQYIHMTVSAFLGLVKG